MRRSRGFEWMIASTRPCDTTQCISLPSPVSLSTSITSTKRPRAPFNRYSPSPLRSSRRTIEISENSDGSPPSPLSITTSTSADERDGSPCPPAKITSCIDCPRTANGDCSPSAQSTASVTFDLPDPFGPTITDTPGVKSSFVRSGNDLNPFSAIERRCISRQAPGRNPGSAAEMRAWRPRSPLAEAFQRSRSRLLLRALLRLPGAAADLLAVDLGHRDEAAVVRRPRLLVDPVGHELRAPREVLLQQRLEVDRVLERVLDLIGERLHDRGRHPFEAHGQVHGADDGLADGRQDAIGPDKHLGVLSDALGRRLTEPLHHAEPPPH